MDHIHNFFKNPPIYIDVLEKKLILCHILYSVIVDLTMLGCELSFQTFNIIWSFGGGGGVPNASAMPWSVPLWLRETG